LERIKPYGRHNLYTAKYKPDKYGCFRVPEDAKWIATVYEGYEHRVGHFNPFGSGDIIALILNDERNKFFAVISFLTKEEAKRLAYDLLRLVGDL